MSKLNCRSFFNRYIAFQGTRMSLIASYFDGQSGEVSLEAHIERLSLEFQVLNNLTDNLKKILPDFTDKLEFFLPTISGFLNTSSADTVKLSSKHKATVAKAKQCSFLNYGNMMVTVPENFNGNLPAYLNTLLELTPDTYGKIHQLLGDYNGILSSFITNKEDKTAIKTHTDFFLKIQVARTNRESKLKHFFPTVNGRSKVRLKDVISRMADVDDLFIASTKLTTVQNKQNLQQVDTELRGSIDLLKIIIGNINNKQTTSISPEAAMNISKGAYEVAKEVEHLSVFYYKVIIALKAVDSLADGILAN